MTSSQEPHQPQPDQETPAEDRAQEAQAQEQQPQDAEPRPERPQRQARPRRQRPDQNPALDPRLAQLERRSHRPSKVGDVSLMAIGLIAFVFGVAMHYWVATTVLDSSSEAAESSNVPEATATPGTTTAATATPTVQAQATPTPLPDRTSCEEIRGTQYRSVTEREFFLENCTGG